jgi:hypothetical protein
MRLLPALTISALFLSLALPVQAGSIHKNSTSGTAATIVGRTADASVSTLSGCDDIVTGVTIKDGIVDLGAPAVAAVDVFFVSNNICDIGSSTSFAGTVPLLSGELTQTGTDSATFEKSFNVAGHDLHLTLAWAGTGTVTVDAATGKSTRTAAVSGTFVVDGLDQISGNSILQGGLSVTQTSAKGGVCGGKGQHEEKTKKEKAPHHHGRDIPVKPRR